MQWTECFIIAAHVFSLTRSGWGVHPHLLTLLHRTLLRRCGDFGACYNGEPCSWLACRTKSRKSTKNIQRITFRRRPSHSLHLSQIRFELGTHYLYFYCFLKRKASQHKLKTFAYTFAFCEKWCNKDAYYQCSTRLDLHDVQCTGCWNIFFVATYSRISVDHSTGKVVTTWHAVYSLL